jgi:hypothetical protein
MPFAIASWRNSATDQWDKGRPRRDGNSHANALIAMTTLGGKAGRAPASRPFVKTRNSLDIEALAPLADDLTRRVETGSDAVVAKPLARQKYDFGPHDLTIR